MEERVLAIDVRIAQVERPPEVALARPLDLDHTRAHVRQPESSQRPRKELAEVQHEQALEGEVFRHVRRTGFTWCAHLHVSMQKGSGADKLPFSDVLVLHI